MSKHKALIIGASGVIGKNLTQYLAKDPQWDVIALAREKFEVTDHVEFVSIDLMDANECMKKLKEIEGITHGFYCAYTPRASMEESVEPNTKMFTNIVNALEQYAPTLQRIVMLQGVMAYGVHLGPFKTPAKESDPRHVGENFYYSQEDILNEKQKGKSWSWCAVRPDAITGYSLGNPMNLTMVIAAYAAICKELGQPLRFPGSEKAYYTLFQVTDAELLAKALTWAATAPKLANEIVNITNGDYFRWKNLWPRFAEFFEMEVAAPKEINLAEEMADKGPVWDKIVGKYNLKSYRLEQVAAWPFGDFIFHLEYDVMSDLTKARQLGFNEMNIDTEENFIKLFKQYRKTKIIP